ncbi:MAG: hypothetical protein WD872_17915 [Pirellulaceae bacterium]
MTDAESNATRVDNPLPSLVEFPQPGQLRFWQSHVEYVTGTFASAASSRFRSTRAAGTA